MKIKILVFVIVLVLLIGAAKAYGLINTPDRQCLTFHTTTSKQPTQLKTAQDFFALGNYQYDIGNCLQAIVSYTQAIQLDPNFAEAYNNRAYTYMRLRNYKDALLDLDQAIAINPQYVEALMNRGDIYNYYYTIDKQKALADYHNVVALGKEKDKSGSVCGHIAMAETNGMIPLAFLKVFTNTTCK